MALVRNGIGNHGRRLLPSLLPSARHSLTAASPAYAPTPEFQQQPVWGRHYGQQRRSMVLVRKKRERLTVVLVRTNSLFLCVYKLRSHAGPRSIERLTALLSFPLPFPHDDT